jgi:type I restriction enzyme S subunit
MNGGTGLLGRENYPIVPLDELCDLCSGITKGRKIGSAATVEVPYMAVANVQDGSLKLDNVKTIKATPEEIQRYRLLPGDLLLTEGGDPDKLGRGAIWNGEITSCIHQNHIFRARKASEHVDMKYLAHLVSSPYGKRYFLRHSKQTTGIASINMGQLKRFPVPLPPLEEQRRIAAILDKGESIKALYAKREKAFLSVEEALFTALHEDDNRGLSGKAYSLSDVFWFQEGPGVRNWQFTTSGVKLLNVGNITIDGRVDLRRSERHVSEDEAFGRYSHFLVDEGDLLMPSSGIPIEGDGLLRTRSAFATSSDLPLCMNTSTIRFKPKMEEASLLFLQGWLQSREFRAQITKLVTGSAQKNFGPSHLKQLSITLPHPSLQDDFEKRLMRIRELRYSLNPSASNMVALMASLGNLAFNGAASA